MSADGKWWGEPGHWFSSTSADGSMQWDGAKWIATDGVAAPACLETLDHASLEANRLGKVTASQILRLAPGFLLGWLYPAAILAGCVVDLALVFIVLSVILVTIVTLPVALLLLILEWVRGARQEEGRLVIVGKGRGRKVSVSDTLVRARGWNIDRMVEGDPHRLYFTRMFHRLVNYERLRV